MLSIAIKTRSFWFKVFLESNIQVYINLIRHCIKSYPLVLVTSMMKYHSSGLNFDLFLLHIFNLFYAKLFIVMDIKYSAKYQSISDYVSHYENINVTNTSAHQNTRLLQATKMIQYRPNIQTLKKNITNTNNKTAPIVVCYDWYVSDFYTCLNTCYNSIFMYLIIF